jgi:ribose transport system permease protein
MTNPEVLSASPRRLPSFGLDRFSGLYLWVLFIAVFGIWEPHIFLTTSTLHSIAANQAIAGMLALAVLVPLATGAYDLSVGATINLSTIVAITLQSSHHWSMGLAIAAAIGVSFLIGLVNGFVVVKLHVSSFIATLGMATVVGAFQAIVSDQTQPSIPTSSAWSTLTQFSIGGFQIVFLYLIVIAAFFWWLFDYTPAGRYLFATGGNPEAARLAGVRTGQWTWTALIISATLSGIAGVFYGSLSGPSLTFGPSLLLPAFAACFLGSTQLRPGRFNVWGTMIAIYVLATGVDGMELVTGQQWINDMFNGLALIIAVAFAVWRQSKSGSLRRRKTAVDPASNGHVGEAVTVSSHLLSPLNTELDSATSDQP